MAGRVNQIVARMGSRSATTLDAEILLEGL